MSDPTPDFASLLVESAIPESWLQGRTAFGGVLAGLLLARLEREVDSSRPLRSALLSFVGPARTGPVELKAEVLRAGGSTTQAQGWLRQGDALCATCVALFGAARDGQPHLGDAEPATFPEPATLPELPYLPGITPVFTRHFEYRWAEGQPPFTGAKQAAIGGWIRFRRPPAALNPAALLALLDAWPVPILSAFTAPGPASTVTWHAQLFADAAALDPGSYLSYRGASRDGRDGYVDLQAELRTASGELLVRATQCVAVYHP